MKNFFGRDPHSKISPELFPQITHTTPLQRLSSRDLHTISIHKGNMVAVLDLLEEFLILSDTGIDITMKCVETLKADILSGNIKTLHRFITELNDYLLSIIGTELEYTPFESGRLDDLGTPMVIMLVGVNGVGKTSSVAKLANYAKQEFGCSVLIAAADTYRAAAIEQMQYWGDKIGIEVVSQQYGADPAAVIYDAMGKGIATGANVVLCDTSGRLHNNDNLMKELEKSARVLKKMDTSYPHEVLLVLDSTLGSNSIQQARVFMDYISPTGIILTKIDAQRQPGSTFQIVDELNMPLRFVSYGEKIDQISPFQPYAFVGDFISGFMDTLTPLALS